MGVVGVCVGGGGWGRSYSYVLTNFILFSLQLASLPYIVC